MIWSLGQKLENGKYTIEKMLGVGGFGVTYQAEDNRNRPVVIKTLKDGFHDSPYFDKLQQDFLNEALKLAKCNHRYIPKVYEVIQERGLWCMVMEYIKGEDVGTLIERRGIFTELEILPYVNQISEALKAVHAQGILHRDIKPQNIMLRQDCNEAVLIDFGISREFIPNITQTHTQMLTPGFAPIEQYDLQTKRGAYTDIYALAATIYTAITGNKPESVTTRDRRVLKAQPDPLIPPQQINSQISDRLNSAIVKGMEIEPEDRPQSIEEWLSLLPSEIPPTYIINPNLQLNSAVGVDYSKLQNLLADRQWQQADAETAKVMLQAANREQEGFLRDEDLKRFPCIDLETIDNLWVHYSRSRFGFSVQNNIWQEIGGKLDADYETYCRFGDRIGWRIDRQWVSYTNFIFDRDNAPDGHLPAVSGCKIGVFCCIHSIGSRLFWRVQECQFAQKSINFNSLDDKKWSGIRMIGYPDSDYDYFSADWNGLIFICGYGELFSFPTDSNYEFEIHVVEKADCEVLSERIAIAIRDKKYEQSNILAVIGQKYELILLDNLLSLSKACKSSDMKMVIWFDEQLSFDDRLAGLNQNVLSNSMWDGLRPPKIL